MIREKIFRLHRHKSSLSGQKFDFTFSNIQLIQVPKGWDKLSLSLISSQSGKTVHKSGKVSVKNGTCKWTETLSESIWISDVDGSKEMEEHLTKFHVAMGSSRSSVLGEATLNLAAFLSSEFSTLVSLPLKKCNHGTILQAEVRCLTPKANLSEEKWKDMHARKDENADHDNIENLSEVSDCKVTKSTETRPQEPCSRETSFSASILRHSFDSIDDSIERQSFGRQDSIESNDSASFCSYSTHGSIKSVRSIHSGNQSEDFRRLSPLLQQHGGSSKLSDDAKVQELETEARMWEQNARKLAADLETLRKELSDQNSNLTNLNVELDTSRSECQKLSQEIEHLKSLLEESSMKQKVIQNSEIQETLKSNMQREFEDEIKFQKELNEDLSLRLEKTQESNIELLSILQEMEETIEKQKVEIESLAANTINDEVPVEQLKVSHPEENDYSLELKLLNLQSEILVLESTLEDKLIETEIEQDAKNRILKECLAEYNRRLSAEEQRIIKLEAELLTAFKEDETGLMDKHLTKLEEENIYLLQRVSGLEAQLRYLNNANESSRSELQHSESQITRLEQEVESQKLGMTHKLLEMEKRCSEAEEECKSLSRLNIRLEATTESVVEEYNLLQKLNGVLKEQKLKLQKQCMILEAEARTFQEKHLRHEKAEEESATYELESRIKASELEKLQLSEENSVLRMELRKVLDLQSEVFALRVSLKEVKSENKQLEASFKSVSADYEELKSEKVAMVQTVSCMQKAVVEAEEYRRKMNALEEKILRLEGDLIARDALFV
ncbi:E3 ubiquitin ligase involved in syntaxin degradation [Handroanthus impetiginosus]|uniref:E3 ubiquitin ligase involved in syntaxin degradation n=1 Tax=Handroanthus impetiginosus TaxID=429701 RepID=A0A2G9GHV9_9LAMI|nr:E3 ubiquitin ligase involved in syntaxin degradation [Handroanthus impetiginosus]